MTKNFYPIPDQKTLKKILLRCRETIVEEIHSLKDLMTLLMKGTDGRWTKGEIREIKTHLVHLSKKIPELIVFLLPGGLVLLPILVHVLDRRKKDSPVSRERRKKL
jgi:hypothetical protein